MNCILIGIIGFITITILIRAILATWYLIAEYILYREAYPHSWLDLFLGRY